MKIKKLSFEKYINVCLDKKKLLLAFNIQNIYQLNALANVCKKNNFFAIAQFSSRYVENFDKKNNFKLIKRNNLYSNLFFHLDHCLDIKIIKFCIKRKFDGVMFDGSSLNISENVKKTNYIYKNISRPNNVLLEAEVGEIKGEEDGFKTRNLKVLKTDINFFINNANFNLLALGAGNQHGISKNKKVDFRYFRYLVSLKKNIKLVFHGGSGFKISKLKKLIKYGVVKINFSSNLKREMTKLNIIFSKKNKLFDEQKYEEFIQKNLEKFFYKFLVKF